MQRIAGPPGQAWGYRTRRPRGPLELEVAEVEALTEVAEEAVPVDAAANHGPGVPMLCPRLLLVGIARFVQRLHDILELLGVRDGSGAPSPELVARQTCGFDVRQPHDEPGLPLCLQHDP